MQPKILIFQDPFNTSEGVTISPKEATALLEDFLDTMYENMDYEKDFKKFLKKAKKLVKECCEAHSVV
jgi:hypothetical protein